MGQSALGIFFRIAGIVAVACIVMLFFLEAGTAEFVITLISLVLSLTVAVISGIMLNREK